MMHALYWTCKKKIQIDAIRTEFFCRNVQQEKKKKQQGASSSKKGVTRLFNILELQQRDVFTQHVKQNRNGSLLALNAEPKHTFAFSRSTSPQEARQTS